jgi:ubiquinone/menaquinone biosynthesis C-methylase UbiE
MSFLNIEGIPGPGAKIYSTVVAKSKIINDFYRDVAIEVTTKLSAGTILDIGTGPGYVPIDIARESSSLEVKAIDISPAMVAIASKNAQKAGLERRVQFKFGSAEKIPFEDKSFDLIISTLSFHHWARPEKCFQEIHRALKPGGEAWIYEIRQDVPEEAKQQLRKSYGWFLTFLVLYVVRLHSSVKLQRFKELCTVCKDNFSKIETEEKGITMKLRMVK